VAFNTFSTWLNTKRRKKPGATLTKRAPIFAAIALLFPGGAMCGGRFQPEVFDSIAGNATITPAVDANTRVTTRQLSLFRQRPSSAHIRAG